MVQRRSAPLNHNRRCPLLICSNQYGDPGSCLGTVWADTDNPVYHIEIDEEGRDLFDGGTVGSHHFVVHAVVHHLSATTDHQENS